MFKLFYSILFVFLLFFCFDSNAQNIEKTKERIQILASQEFGGRGYVNFGGDLAAVYIAEQMEKAGLKQFGESYFQEFRYNINTFPGKISVKLNNKTLIPGTDFLIGPASPTVKNKYPIFLPDSLLLNDTIKFLAELVKNNYKEKAFVIDYAQTQNIDIKKFYINIMRYNSWFGCIVELIPEELMWSVSTKVQTYPVVKIKRESFDKKTQMIKLNSKSEYVKDFEARNVIGYVEGEKDEFIVFTAHYDHLGWMGKDVFIPGAQDNASGTALVLDLADYYSKNKPEYSIAFMLFFGEEAGLFGSTYYVMNPLFDLKKIKAVFNLDMVGTGDDGITVVNGAEEEYKDIWNLIDKINKENEFFTEIKARKESANSDHYPFHAKGVRAVFIYTMGGKTYYHNPKDKPETLTFTGYNQLFGLLTKFVEEYE
ncbi:MAG: M28 family peptidase [Bacteroidales bacterium]|nr:M28 family peptidase [Bacteroidales bacterium]